MPEARHEDRRLVYRVEPIYAFDGASVSDERVGAELLYRGCESNAPDVELLESLIEREPWSAPIHINMSTAQILGFQDRLLRKAAMVQPLVIEWVESFEGVSTASDIPRAGDRLAYWRSEWGVRVCIDNWGRGIDGVSRILAVPHGPDMVKISGPLFQSIMRNAVHAGDRAVLHLAEGLLQGTPPEIRRIAGWVERQEDLQLARWLKADAVQGHLFPARELHLDERPGG